ncbi:hypothetical protein P152DRAFT_241287 [Eremomyces bilateralis CBS 781.70]|uniref:Uncharacterized protein n=1 Tax=Eremomyces bilateralis CBS 781.70 TaxID=1392243 RepID=A0A6G1GAR3_9PEZI|nr:uncharacterized protein P152DRAFT_241287 [Eremomyces bilateralis CBS 781.70]KAF1814990.1 hypothetical protein P152DRAFT_241287 [Eremomyces bilateralis CBS 781.70]
MGGRSRSSSRRRRARRVPRLDPAADQFAPPPPAPPFVVKDPTSTNPNMPSSYMYPQNMSDQDFFTAQLYDEQSAAHTAYAQYLDTVSTSTPISSMESLQSLQAPFFTPAELPDARFPLDPSQTGGTFENPYSPPESPLQPLDMNAPRLSTASDSTGSLSSTSSSTIPSPALPAAFEAWSYAGLGLSQAEGFPMSQAFISSSSYDAGPILAAAPKDPGCVGESSEVPSLSHFSVSSAFPSSSESFKSPVLRYPRRSSIARPFLENTSSPTATTPTEIPRSNGSTVTPIESQDGGMFKSPSLPASRMASPYLRCSQVPQQEPHGGPRSVAGSPVAPRRNSLLSHQIWPPSAAVEPVQGNFPASSESLSSPFFHQSSGIFVPPLESSSANSDRAFRSFSYRQSFRCSLLIPNRIQWRDRIAPSHQRRTPPFPGLFSKFGP